MRHALITFAALFTVACPMASTHTTIDTLNSEHLPITAFTFLKGIHPRATDEWRVRIKGSFMA